jgi:magnesium chelatase family protein
MNPCPCGYYGDPDKECVCSSTQIMAYQKRLSGPLLDRIDLILNVSKVNHIQLLTNNTLDKKQHVEVYDHIMYARIRQVARYNSSNIYNASLSSADIKKQLKLSPEATKLLVSAAQRLALSARSYFKIIKVAQTIADLDTWPQDSVHRHASNQSAGTIEVAHIAEALQYRLASL